MSWYTAFKAKVGEQSVNSVNSVIDEIAEDDAAERAAIQAEPRMPPPDSPERERLDREQRAMVAGLLKAAVYPERRRPQFVLRLDDGCCNM